MSRTFRALLRAVAAPLILLIAVTGCGSSEPPDDPIGWLHECGRIDFPEGVTTLGSHRQASSGIEDFGVVVEMDPDQLASFKEMSGLGPFEPGLPKAWMEFWESVPHASVLETDSGNQHYHDFDGDIYRRFVLHTREERTSLMFAMSSADCGNSNGW